MATQPTAAAAAYQPAEGSVPARAIAHLATLPEGTWLRTSDLASAIDAPVSSMTPSLKTAVDRGALLTRQESGRFLEWALPSARDAFEADERRGGKPVQRIVPAKAAAPVVKAGPSSVFDVKPPADWRPPPTPARKASGPVATRPQRAVPAVLAPHQPSVVCAVFNSGELLIEAPGQAPLRLAPEQTRDLISWLRTFQPVEVERVA